jgi:hypothetical protein
MWMGTPTSPLRRVSSNTRACARIVRTCRFSLLLRSPVLSWISHLMECFRFALVGVFTRTQRMYDVLFVCCLLWHRSMSAPFAGPLSPSKNHFTRTHEDLLKIAFDREPLPRVHQLTAIGMSARARYAERCGPSDGADFLTAALGLARWRLHTIRIRYDLASQWPARNEAHGVQSLTAESNWAKPFRFASRNSLPHRWLYSSCRSPTSLHRFGILPCAFAAFTLTRRAFMQRHVQR